MDQDQDQAGDLVTVADIAARTGVRSPTVVRWSVQEGWPAERLVLRAGRKRAGYPWPEVQAWLAERGLPDARAQALAAKRRPKDG